MTEMSDLGCNALLATRVVSLCFRPFPFLQHLYYIGKLPKLSRYPAAIAGVQQA